MAAVEPGADLGVTGWHTITQRDVDEFGRITGDRQWIHTDPARAAAHSPFGGPIAHGMLVLALSTRFATDLLGTEAQLIVHKGLTDVGFTAPVPAGATIRGRGQIIEVCERRGATDVTVRITVELRTEGEPRTVAVAIQTLSYVTDARWIRLAATMSLSR
jgi:acyl dehydratase